VGPEAGWAPAAAACSLLGVVHTEALHPGLSNRSDGGRPARRPGSSSRAIRTNPHLPTAPALRGQPAAVKAEGQQPGLRERRLFHPVFDTFVHALPHTYREVAVADGSHVRLVITGEAGGAWSLLRVQELWALFVDVKTPPTCVVTLDEEAAWRLFTRGIDAAAARKRAAIEGDEILGAVLLRAVAIIA